MSGVAITFGFSAAPKFLDGLIQRFGFAGAWFVLGCLTLSAMALLGWLFFRDNPEECGLQMDGRVGEPPIHRNLDMLIRRDFSQPEALRTFTFWVFNLSFAFFALYSTAFTFHIVSLGQEFGITREWILTLFMPVAGVSVLTATVYGALNSRLRLKHLLLVMNVAAVLCAVGLFSLDHRWGVWAYVAGSGVTNGAFANLTGIVWPRFFGRRWLGAISGFSMATMVVASGLGPLLFGITFQWSGSYKPILFVSILVPAILAVLSLGADNPQRKLAVEQ